ncbi:hypothetical protein A462_00049 [Pseudomonas sp. Ag1]|jgi:DNA relaxase NicK|nr:replication initiation factor domain-containing protein [Pseudomonas sp. Ag1]EJF74082.1 hypothetical protein A462_00049 [Pseudomonas sp. Ag1]NBF18029.1 replication initiation factor [Pseudomonas sp. Fl4BN2]
MAEFDAYSATSRALKVEKALGLVWFPGGQIREGRGFHGFEKRWSVTCEQTREEVGSVSSGGTHGDLVMLEVKGLRTREVVPVLREEVPEHACTRVDACVDFDRPGAWDDLLGILAEVKQEQGLKGEKRGDWDFPEDGRTMYLGANSSPVRCRLYEKGKQPGYRSACRWDWVRLEAQVRPQKDARRVFSTLSADQVWGASGWTRKIAQRAFSLETGAFPAAGVKKDTDFAQRWEWVCAQAAPTLLEAIEVFGDWESVRRNLIEGHRARLAGKRGC